jgi:putative flavoprotein involved in K+ transport
LILLAPSWRSGLGPSSKVHTLMNHVPCLIIGAGQAGLALSRCLTDRSIRHVLLERGRVGERWRSERWDSLRLLTPNWQNRLPGFDYDGPDPDGYMTMSEVAGHLERYAASFGAPVQTGTAVQSVARDADSFVVTAANATWRAEAVVIATGYSDSPFVPDVAARFPRGITHIVPSRYRRPADLGDGGVLMVGASATGIQLADEIQRSGRNVTIAVGRHTRMPRRYRGRDILWWLDRMGIFDETADQVYDLGISREQPSFQLVGHPNHISLDLAGLADRGVHVVGRLTDVIDGVARFADDLVATTAAADIKLASLLARIDRFIDRSAAAADPPMEFEPHCWRFGGADTSVPLADRGIRTVVWATGYRRRYPWLHVPVLDEHGEILHAGGVSPLPGLYAIGLHFLRRRKSAFIDGVGADALALADHIVAFLGRSASAAVA